MRRLGEGAGEVGSTSFFDHRREADGFFEHAELGFLIGVEDVEIAGAEAFGTVGEIAADAFDFGVADAKGGRVERFFRGFGGDFILHLVDAALLFRGELIVFFVVAEDGLHLRVRERQEDREGAERARRGVWLCPGGSGQEQDDYGV